MAHQVLLTVALVIAVGVRALRRGFKQGSKKVNVAAASFPHS
jgi:hypothetical protein